MYDRRGAGVPVTQISGPSVFERDDGHGVSQLSNAVIRALYVAEQSRLLKLARRRTGDVDDAADIVQDAFARLIQARPPVTLRTPAAYLHRILRNLLADRSKLAEHRLVDRCGDLSHPPEPAVLPEQEWHLEATDLMNGYHAAIDTLPPRTREIFLLHRVDELRYRDIAERLGITASTVEYHMTRALIHLDAALGR